MNNNILAEYILYKYKKEKIDHILASIKLAERGKIEIMYIIYDEDSFPVHHSAIEYKQDIVLWNRRRKINNLKIRI